MRIARNIRQLEAYVPGEQPRAKNVVKLNTNENAYPPSPACADVLKDFDLDRLRRYPDPNFTALRAALAKLNRTTPDKVFVGNGSDEILSLAARCFVDEGGAIGSAWKPSKKVSLFLWTNPNAPTGTLAPRDEIAAFAKSFKGVVIVDEAYADFARANCMDLATAESNENLIVLRTFSKSYSLAGLRVGYCVGPVALIDALYKAKDSYNVDALAQAVALAAVRDQKWMKANVRKIVRTRAAFTKTLAAGGWDVLPSESNFVFAKPPAALGTAKEVFDYLRAKNIFVRYFPGPLTGDRLRITIGTDDQMRALLAALDAKAKAMKRP